MKCYMNTITAAMTEPKSQRVLKPFPIAKHVLDSVHAAASTVLNVGVSFLPELTQTELV